MGVVRRFCTALLWLVSDWVQHRRRVRRLADLDRPRPTPTRFRW